MYVPMPIENRKYKLVHVWVYDDKIYMQAGVHVTGKESACMPDGRKSNLSISRL
jgi:hypothetical protein